jgi:hypothetical protein
VAHLSAKSLSALDDTAVNNNPAAETRADYYRNGRGPSARAEVHRVAPESGRVPIVKVRHRFAEFVRKISADIESGPVLVHKVRRTSCAEHALRARRTWGVEANDCYVSKSNTRLFDSDFETGYDLLEANFRPFS